jgi:hypothetical protein
MDPAKASEILSASLFQREQNPKGALSHQPQKQQI